MSSYETLVAGDVWINRDRLVDKKMCRTLGRKKDEYDPAMYTHLFKTLARVETGPHNCTMVFTDGSREQLISYDYVWVHNP